MISEIMQKSSIASVKYLTKSYINVIIETKLYNWEDEDLKTSEKLCNKDVWESTIVVDFRTFSAMKQVIFNMIDTCWNYRVGPFMRLSHIKNNYNYKSPKNYKHLQYLRVIFSNA